LLWPLPLTMVGFTACSPRSLMRMRAELAETKVEARLRRSAPNEPWPSSSPLMAVACR
jgi:heme exporter protein C